MSGVTYENNRQTVEFDIPGGKLKITTRFSADSATAARFAVSRECEYTGTLPREIMLDLVRWAEGVNPTMNSMKYNDMTLLELLESM